MIDRFIALNQLPPIPGRLRSRTSVNRWIINKVWGGITSSHKQMSCVNKLSTNYSCANCWTATTKHFLRPEKHCSASSRRFVVERVKTTIKAVISEPFVGHTCAFHNTTGKNQNNMFSEKAMEVQPHPSLSSGRWPTMQAVLVRPFYGWARYYISTVLCSCMRELLRHFSFSCQVLTICLLVVNSGLDVWHAHLYIAGELLPLTTPGGVCVSLKHNALFSNINGTITIIEAISCFRWEAEAETLGSLISFTVHLLHGNMGDREW